MAATARPVCSFHPWHDESRNKRNWTKQHATRMDQHRSEIGINTILTKKRVDDGNGADYENQNNNFNVCHAQAMNTNTIGNGHCRILRRINSVQSSKKTDKRTGNNGEPASGTQCIWTKHNTNNNSEHINNTDPHTTMTSMLIDFVSFLLAIISHKHDRHRSEHRHRHSLPHSDEALYPHKSKHGNCYYSILSFPGWLALMLAMSTQVGVMDSSADADKSNITWPVTGFPSNSSILSLYNSSLTITARDSVGALSNGTYFAQLYSYDTCEVGYASSSCEVLCYPYNSPHSANPQCTSYSSRFTKGSDSALWVVADVTFQGSSEYDITYDDKVEVSDDYDVSVYLLTNGGLRGRYWDNIWMVDSAVNTEIDTEINFNWGTSAITTYGTDYVSIRWEGKIKPPYNETYTFYIYADDGARLWIDKMLIADSWDKCCNETWGSVDLMSTAFHDIIVEYREIRGEAFFEMRWSSDSIAKTIVPSSYLYYQDHISGSPYSHINIGVGEVSYTKTSVDDTSPFLSNTAGVNNSVYVTAKDAFGHVMDSDTANFTLTNLDGMDSIATWQGSGIYEIAYQATTKTANASFSIRVGSPATDILGSPYWVVVDPAATSPENTTLTGDGLTSATAGQQATFNLTGFDEFGNERETGTDTITVRFTGAAAGKGTCSYSGNADGQYNCEYTLTTVGLYTPIVQINSASAGAAPLPFVNVTAGHIHGPSCTIAGETTSLLTGEFESFIVQARDQFSNVIASNAVGFVSQVTFDGATSDDTNATDGNSSRITSTVAAIGGGEYNVSYTPLLKGEYTVNIKLDGVHIDGSPYSVSVSPNSVDAALSYVIGDRRSNNTGGEETGTSNVEASFEVQTVDSENNTLDSDMGGFSTSQVVCGATTIDMNCTYGTADNGRYLCKYTPSTSGICTLTMEIGGTHISDSPFTVDVHPGTIDADTTWIHGLSDGVAGVTSSFVIHGQDTNGNNLTSGGHTFYATLVDLQGSRADVSGTVTDNDDGTYSVDYATDVANYYESVKVELFQIGGLLGNYYTDYALTNVFASLGECVVDATVDFDWGTGIPLDNTFGVSDYFSIQWDGSLYPPYSETYTIYTPINGNSGVKLYIDGVLVIDSWDPALGDSDPFALIQLTANTFYELQLQFREQTGNSKISLEWNSPSIGGREVIPATYLYYTKAIDGTRYVGNVSIIPDVTVATECTVAGSGLTSAIAGDATSVAIVAKDAYGNVQTDSGNEEAQFNITLTHSDSTVTVGTVVDSGNAGADGAYTATYTITDAASNYVLLVTYNGTVVKRTVVSVDPGAISGISGDSTANISNGRAGEQQKFVLFLRDAYNNLCECGGADNGITLQINFTHSDAITVVTPTSVTEIDGGSGNGQGIFIVKYNLTKSGDYTPMIVANGQVINGLPTLNMSNAIASATHSYIQGWEDSVTGTVSAGSTITQYIQVQDIYQNNLTATGGYHFYVTLANGSENDTMFDRGTIRALTRGRYELNYTAAFAGNWILYVELASGDIDEPDGLTGAYYNNRWLYGDPLLTQIDKNISQSWEDGLVTTTAKDYVSVKWTGFIKPSYAESYNFTIISDDGARLYVDGNLIFDEFLSNSGAFAGNYTFPTADLLYSIVIDWRENTGDADIALYWHSASESHSQITQEYMFSKASQIKSGPFAIVAT